MDIDADELLRKSALDGSTDLSTWPALLPIVISRIEKIAHDEFPIPIIPPPAPPVRPPSPRFLAPLPLSDVIEGPDSSDTTLSSQETNKENAVPGSSSPAASPNVATDPADPSAAPNASSQPLAEQAGRVQPDHHQDERRGSGKDAQPPAPRLAPGELPPQIMDLLVEITTTLGAFKISPPHTVQRLAELVLQPKAQHRSLTAYLHALDRVVHVTSGANIYPLPPAVPDMSALHILANGVSGENDPHVEVNSSSAAATVGSDEALGGALLTPIPWLARRATAAANGSDDGSDVGGGSPVGLESPHGVVPSPQAQSSQQQTQRRPQVRTESTETIEGPNGVGSIETVSISINGISSMGAGGGLLAQRGVTQGELLRQEQRAGVVPVSQLARHGQHPQGASESPGSGSSPSASSSATLSDGTAVASAAGEAGDTSMNEDTEPEVPHARGPDEIGAADMGPQNETTSSFTIGSGGALEMHGIDVEAAVGRRVPHPQNSPEHHPTSSSSPPPSAAETKIPPSPKRQAYQALESGLPKRLKEDASNRDTKASLKSEDPVEIVQGEAKEVKIDAEGDIVLSDPDSVSSKKEEVDTKPSADSSAADDGVRVKEDNEDGMTPKDDQKADGDESGAKSQESQESGERGESPV